MSSVNGVPNRRRGFVLLTVMSVVAGTVALGLLVVREAQAFVLTVSNRNAHTLSRWHALDCISRARSALEDDKTVATSVATTWSHLDEFLQVAASVSQSQYCSLSATALGDGINVNAATPHELKRLLFALEIRPAKADSLIDALLDWRDPDSEPRAFGAEAEWYAATNRAGPRNGLLRNTRELSLVRGYENLPTVVRMFTTDGARASLVHSPRAVLASLPGFTPELADEVIRRRSRGSLPSSILELAYALSGASRDSLMLRQGELAARVTIEPDGWVLVSQGRVGGSPVTSVLAVTVARIEGGTQIVSHQESWQ